MKGRNLFWNAASLLIIFSLLLSATFVLSATPVRAQTEPPPTDPEVGDLALEDPTEEEVGQAEPETEALMAKALADGSVGVIVVLNVPDLPDSAASPQRGEDTVQVYAAAQGALMTSLRGRNIQNVYSYNNFPMIAMRVDAAALRALLRHHMVAAVQEDHIDYATLTESTEIVGANEAFDAGYSGAGTTVAIIDSGVQYTHPFLTGKVVEGACFSAANGNGDIYTSSTCPGGAYSAYGVAAGAACTQEGCYHGTHVAGIAAGSNASMTGVARNATIVAYNVFSWNSYYSQILTYESDYLKALDDVYYLKTAEGYNIASVNMSLGGGKYTSYCNAVRPATKKAIDKLRAVNIATIIASGNNGFTDGISAPACISTAISVGSTDKYDNVSEFSNYDSFLSLLAPGESIYSSVTGSGYDYLDGTSMATPHVTGAWAVLHQAFPTKSVSSILSMLKTTGVKVRDYRNGKIKPRINIAYALGKYTKPTSAPELLGPANNANLIDSTPEISFSKVPLANKYKVVIKRNGTSTAVSKTYNASDVCELSGDTCTVHVSTILKTAMHTWTVQAYTGAGGGPISLPRTFYTPTAVPAAVNLVAPVSPIGYYSPSFEWIDPGTPTADKYYFKLYKDGKRVLSKTYEAYKICDHGSCYVPKPLKLKEGAYTWTVQPWNPVGYGAIYTAGFDFHYSNGYANDFSDTLDGFTMLYPYPKMNWWWWDGNEVRTWYGYNYTWTSARIDATYGNLDVSAVMYRDGSPYNSNGIIIRGNPSLRSDKDWKAGYRFLYANDGMYSIWKNYSGHEYMMQPWTYSAAISSGYNTVRVRAVGPNLQFYINGTLVWSGIDAVSGPDYTTGSVGIQTFLADWNDYHDWFYLDSITASVPLTLALEEETVSAEQLALNEAALANPQGSPMGPNVSMADYEFLMGMPELLPITTAEKFQMCLDAGRCKPDLFK